jgi:hypothetical protein
MLMKLTTGVQLNMSDINAVSGKIYAVKGGNNRRMGSLKNSWTNQVASSDTSTFHVICQFLNKGLSAVGNKYFK